ncbi:FKBP-type peptidyl-prolyl cis-trans isomerase [Pseudomonas sp. 5P_3.1_Bac2]|uniref:FKBP-type peptidyl-prolyl cis-trans isomerase n=1 Tax=Pseudomonas sp. 5P_3.1_Bac2 TaxID=2971617 RepID=UPI0021C6E713|nr:FKBP-type peptidyl-prolyl cis-trans isomerase [Pseudomonas sp. 5P_3.1_Bac2]MCU1718001.1 FKBP-type peptidyl-prolyl cis-trans isomerase [Pseudomonas sp. 5P_3.1_Bac2]
MHRLCLLLLCLLLPQAYGQDDEHDLAYSVGVELGERLRDELPSLQLQALVEGLQQAYANKPLAIERTRMQQLLDQHAEQLLANTDQQRSAKLAEGRFLASEKAKAGVQVLANGVLMQQLRAGNGAKPTAHSQVLVTYKGYLADGSLFDQSSGAQWFKLDSVISGWQSTLPQMPVGAHWRLVIPSAQAYGAQGAGDLIAPFSPLVFELQLLDTQQ